MEHYMQGTAVNFYQVNSRGHFNVNFLQKLQYGFDKTNRTSISSTLVTSHSKAHMQFSQHSRPDCVFPVSNFDGRKVS
jgi:hypothetical protein